MPKEMIDKLPEWQLGYIAGILDGEGHIGLAKRPRQGYKPRIEVACTEKSMLITLATATGMGKLYFRPMPKNRKPMWRWCIDVATDIYVLLSRLLPYLIIKEPQAKVLINYCSAKITGVSCDEDECFNQLLKLNKRGAK